MFQNRLLVFLFLGLFTVGFCLAEETDYDETVSVTASLTPIKIEQTGSSITVVDRTEIERRQSIFLGDLLRGIPGVAVSRSGNAGSLTQIRIRGAEANQILLSIDGVSINDVFAGDEVPLELLTVFDVEQVEVLRGPQSGLWGGDAAAGVINLVTTEAGASAGRGLRFETGSFGLTRGAGQIGIGSGEHRATFTGSFHDTDGTNVSRVGNEDDGSSSGTATVRYRFDPASSPFALELSGRHTDAESDFDSVDFFVTGLPIDANRRTDTTLSLFSARGTWNNADSDWQHRMTASRVTSDTATIIDDVFDSSTDVVKNSLAWQSSLKFGDRLDQQVTFAADYEDREFEQRGMATFFGDPNQSQGMDTTGGVVEYRLGNKHWDWNASVRHDLHSDFDDATTYRSSVSRRWSDGATRLRASAGTGQKPPTFIERFGFFADTFIGNPDLQPEETRGWDLGVDRRFGTLLQAGVTYFREQLENEINGFFFDPLIGPFGSFTAVNEDGKSDRRGVELSLLAQPLKTLQLALAYTYTDASESDESVELRRPRHTANLQLRYDPASLPLELTLNASHVGTQRDIFFPPFPTPSEIVRLDSYLLVDIMASYRLHDRYELFARVENALDEDYEDVIGFATPDLGVFVGVRIK